MRIQQALFLVLVSATVIYSFPTFGLLSPLKNHVQKTRCKLHQIGSKVVEHGHVLGDPCEGSNGVERQSTTTTEEVEKEKFVATSEAYPSSLDIDIRMNGNGPTPTTRKSGSFDVTEQGDVKIPYATVPSGGGKHIIIAKCNGALTKDGCLETI